MFSVGLVIVTHVLSSFDILYLSLNSVIDFGRKEFECLALEIVQGFWKEDHTFDLRSKLELDVNITELSKLLKKYVNSGKCSSLEKKKDETTFRLHPKVKMNHKTELAKARIWDEKRIGIKINGLSHTGLHSTIF